MCGVATSFFPDSQTPLGPGTEWNSSDSDRTILLFLLVFQHVVLEALTGVYSSCNVCLWQLRKMCNIRQLLLPVICIRMGLCELRK